MPRCMYIVGVRAQDRLSCCQSNRRVTQQLGSFHSGSFDLSTPGWLIMLCVHAAATLRLHSYNCLTPAGLKVLRDLPQLERLELRAMRPELTGVIIC